MSVMLEHVYKEYGGMTDEEAERKLIRMGYFRKVPLERDALEGKPWKKELRWLCDAPERNTVQMLVPSGPVMVRSTESFNPTSKIKIEFVQFAAVIMGYSHWVPDIVKGEPGNGYWIDFRWFNWKELNPVK